MNETHNYLPFVFNKNLNDNLDLGMVAHEQNLIT